MANLPQGHKQYYKGSVCVCDREEDIKQDIKKYDLLPDQQKTNFVVTVWYKYVEEVKCIQTHELNIHNYLQVAYSQDQI